MPPAKKTCKNHPDKLTTRKCYHCGEPICTACQFKREGHIFCSRMDYIKWKFRQLPRQITVSRQTVILIGVIILSNLLVILYFNYKIERLSQSRPEPVTEASGSNAAVQASLDTSRVQLGQFLKIKLQIGAGRLAILWREGRFIESQWQEKDSVNFSAQQLHSGRNSFSLLAIDGKGNAGIIDTFVIELRSLRLDQLRKSIYEFSGAGNGVALTFDGGSLDRGTKEILEILKTAGVRCTMFLTGDFILKYKDLVSRIISDGHEIGNHSFHHPHLTALEIDGSSNTLPNINRDIVQAELQKTDSLFHSIFGRRMSLLWRAPYGEINRDILTWAAEIGYRHVGWSQKGDTRDWVSDTESKLYRNGPQILESIMNLEESSGLGGKIILMHLGTERNIDEPYRVLPEIISEIRGRGYQFCTVSELIAREQAAARRLADGSQNKLNN